MANKNWLILSQTCTHCFEVMAHIHNEDLMGLLMDYNIEMQIVSSVDRRLGRETHLGRRMEETLLWLADNVDETYGDHLILAPVLVLNGEAGITDVIRGAPAIIDYFQELRNVTAAKEPVVDEGVTAVRKIDTLEVRD